MNLYRSILMMSVSAFSIGCFGGKDFDSMVNSINKNTVPQISNTELSKELLSDSIPYIIDTREFAEYKVSHIKNAQYVGYNHFSMDSLRTIPKTSKIVAYCSVGYRSGQIAEKLIKLGYTKVYNLYGGIFKWVNNGYPVVDMKGITTNKIHAYSKRWGKWLTKGEKVYDN